MTKNRLLYTFMVAFSAVLFSACGGGGSSHRSDSGDGGGDSGGSIVTLADYSVILRGPGGHSNGAYGNTNALHAASRAIVRLEELCDTAKIKFYVKELSGGESVNSIAGDGNFTVGLVEGDEAAFKSLVEAAADYGSKAENRFRRVTEGQITNNLRMDIRIDSITKL
jgi:hypothetical protein